MTEEQLDLLSAARRHVADAEALLAEGPQASPDQAWHLAGFGPECIRKACLENRSFNRALGHNLGEAAEVLLEWAISMDPYAWRYDLIDLAGQAPRLAEWHPSHRYERTGTRQGDPVAELVEAARGFVDRVHADLWADGRITGEGL